MGAPFTMESLSYMWNMVLAVAVLAKTVFLVVVRSIHKELVKRKMLVLGDAAIPVRIDKEKIHDVRVEVFYPRTPVEIGKPYKMHVLITNEQTNEQPFKWPTSMTWTADSYHQKRLFKIDPVPLPPFASVGIWIDVGVVPGAMAWDLEETFIILFGEEKFEFKTNMSFFIGSIARGLPAYGSRHLRGLPALLRDRLPTDLNLMVYGIYGTGKSSLINKFHTLLANTAQPTANFAIAGTGGTHATKEIRRIVMPNSNISITDFWGIDFRNNDETLEQVIEGNLPSGWEMANLESVDKFHKDLIKEGEKTNYLRRIHGALFVVSFDWIKPMVAARKQADAGGDLKNKYLEDGMLNMQKLQGELHKLQDLSPIIVVSRSDELLHELLGEEILAGGEWSMENPQVLEIKKTVAQICLVAEKDVYFNQNYVNQTSRSAFFDQQTFVILSEAVRRAQETEARVTSGPRYKF